MLAITGIAAYGAEFRAGAGKSEIQTSPDMWPLESYTSVHDQASIRVLVMDDGKSRFAIACIETPSAGDSVIGVAKAALTKAAGVPAENAIVFTTHSTSAPHIAIGGPMGEGPQGARPGAPGGQGGPGGPGGQGGPGGPGGGPGGQNRAGATAYAKAYEAAVQTAVQQAADSMRPAKVGFGVGATNVAVSRDVPTPRGWAQGSNSAAFSDRSLPVIRVEGADGKPIAIVMNVSVRPVVVDASKDGKDGGKALSADLSGATSRYVEQWYGGNTVAIFLMGAAVDQAPVLQGNRSVLNRDGSMSQIDQGAAGFTLLDLLGERVGSDVIQTSESIKAAAQPTMEVVRKTIKVPSQGRVATNTGPNSGPVQSYTYPDKGVDIDLPLVVMRIGDIAIPGIQPELASALGAQIKEHSSYPNTMMVTMADGNSKYMVDAQSFDRFTAEARGSQYARGAGESVVKEIDDLLKQMKQSGSGK
jgi:hypothetical protein